MPRVTHIQTNFTAGELSPGTLGRVDIERYPNGCKIIENANVLVQGGVTNTYGSYFVNAAKNANKRNRLIPFVYSTTQAYILEFGDLYLRFYINNARVETSPGVAYELATPYTEAMLSSLDYTQRGDTMFVFHPSVEPYRVRRFADNLWDAQPAQRLARLRQPRVHRRGWLAMWAARSVTLAALPPSRLSPVTCW
jgi:hypothetical protein